MIKACGRPYWKSAHCSNNIWRVSSWSNQKDDFPEKEQTDLEAFEDYCQIGSGKHGRGRKRANA